MLSPSWIFKVSRHTHPRIDGFGLQGSRSGIRDAASGRGVREPGSGFREPGSSIREPRFGLQGETSGAGSSGGPFGDRPLKLIPDTGLDSGPAIRGKTRGQNMGAKRCPWAFWQRPEAEHNILWK